MSEENKGGWFGRLKAGLQRSSQKITGGITDLFTKRKLDKDALQDLEELLIQGDLGVTTAMRLSESLAKTRFDQEVTPEEVKTHPSRTEADQWDLQHIGRITVSTLTTLLPATCSCARGGNWRPHKHWRGKIR